MRQIPCPSKRSRVDGIIFHLAFGDVAHVTIVIPSNKSKKPTDDVSQRSATLRAAGFGLLTFLGITLFEGLLNTLPVHEDPPTKHLPTCPISGAPASAAAAQTARHAVPPVWSPPSCSASRTRSSTRAVSNCAMFPIRHTTRAPSTFATTRALAHPPTPRDPRDTEFCSPSCCLYSYFGGMPIASSPAAAASARTRPPSRRSSVSPRATAWATDAARCAASAACSRAWAASSRRAASTPWSR